MAKTDEISSVMERWREVESSKAITPLNAKFVDLPVSCLEFVPLKAQRAVGRTADRTRKGRFLVVGTYYLESDDEAVVIEVSGDESPEDAATVQSRSGSLNLYSISSDKISLVQRLSYPSAILNLHFLPDSPIFVIVSSTGCISLYRFQSSTLNNEEGSKGPLSGDDPSSNSCIGPTVEHIITHQVFPPTTLILSFTWYPSSASLPSAPLLACSLSTGAIHLIRFDSLAFKTYEILYNGDPLITHRDQAWCCAFSPPIVPSSPTPSTASEDTHVTLFSGGDDSKLYTTTLTSAPDTPPSALGLSPRPQFHPLFPPAVLKGHYAGVTSILPVRLSVCDPHIILLTGSYDDHMRIYSLPHQSVSLQSKILAELNLGGGVWKMKILRSINKIRDEVAMGEDSDGGGAQELDILVLVSCMHAGAKVVRVSGKVGGEWTVSVLGSVEVHESMCYGCDFVTEDEVDGDEEGEDRERARLICVSTSFYDRLMCVWRFDPEVALGA